MLQCPRPRRLAALVISILLACLAGLTPPGSSAEELGSLAEADQDFQRAMQTWGDGRSPEAEALLNHALAIRLQRLGPGNPGVAQVIERLGALSYNRGRYAEAEERFRKSLDIYQKALGEKNISTVYLMGDLGAALRELHRCQDAQAIVEHSLALYRELLPANDPMMAGRLNNLARIYFCERRYADARAAVEESLRIYRARSIDAGVRDDQALLERLDNADRGIRRLEKWAAMLGAGAVASLAVLLFCNLWSEQRHITDAASRPPLVRIAGIAATVGLFGSVGVLCSFAADWLILLEVPATNDDRYALRGLGRLGFFAGVWLSFITLQVLGNILRRAAGLPTRPVVYFHWSALQPRPLSEAHRAAFADPLVAGPPGSPPWFAAMEYYALILNRTYKVFVTDTMLCGAKVRGLVSNPGVRSPQMADQAYWVQTRSARIYDRVDVTSETFRKMNPANFQIEWSKISHVVYRAGKKWGMGNVPHSGRLVLQLRSGKSRELILLGDQDGNALGARLEQLSRTGPVPGAALRRPDASYTEMN